MLIEASMKSIHSRSYCSTSSLFVNELFDAQHESQYRRQRLFCGSLKAAQIIWREFRAHIPPWNSVYIHFVIVKNRFNVKNAWRLLLYARDNRRQTKFQHPAELMHRNSEIITRNRLNNFSFIRPFFRAHRESLNVKTSSKNLKMLPKKDISYTHN